MISDNNHNTYSAEDIQRYWNGQLSPQEMHALEKAALDDPFLADALEGFGMALESHDQTVVIDQMKTLQQQVQTRTAGAKRTAPVRSFRWWQMAAAALVVFTVAYWLLFMNKTENPTAVNDVVAKQEEKPADKATSAESISLDTLTAKTDIVSRKNDTFLNAIAVGDSPRRSFDANVGKKEKEPGYFEFKTTQPQTKPAGVPVNEIFRSAPPAPVEAKVLQKELAGKTEALNVHFDTTKVEAEVLRLQDVAFTKDKAVRDSQFLKYDNNKAVVTRQNAELKLQNTVFGVVTDNKNNPLANVDIKLENNRYTTDPTGNFKIPVTDTLVNVAVSLPGYATQYFQLRSAHDGAGNMAADNQIKLQPSAQLDEYNGKQSAKKKSSSKDGDDSKAFMEKVSLPAAQPVNGWLEYEKYLEANKRKPTVDAELAGEVHVSFEVNKKGQLSDFKIVKSLSIQHNAEAVRLVKEGPAWQLDRGRKTRITVVVRF